jgi:hypothetical protein
MTILGRPTHTPSLDAARRDAIAADQLRPSCPIFNPRLGRAESPYLAGDFGR